MLGSVRSSSQNSFSASQVIAITHAYLDSARNASDVQIASFFCDHAEVSLSQAKKAFKAARAADSAADQALREQIAHAYAERGRILEKSGQHEKAQASYKKAEKWGYESISVASTSASMPAVDSAVGLVQSTEFFSSTIFSTLSPKKKAEACPPQKHHWVAQTFETILKQFHDLDLCQGSPSLFLVYAHNNVQGKADAEVSQRVIQWLSTLRTNLYSDRSAGGHQALPLPATPEDTAKANDILSSQLCLLPNHNGTAKYVVLCGSELLGHYMASPFYQGFYKAIQNAYQQTVEHTDDFIEVEAAIRKVVNAHVGDKDFHHVLTELAFLQIRYEHDKDKHNVIPLLLNGNAQQCLPKFIVDSTTIRIEESQWRQASHWKGQQTYQDEGLHIGFFRLLKQLVVKRERCIQLVEKEVYQACLQKLREDSAHTLTAEDFSVFLNQSCVTALDALKQEHSADLRELNVQRAYESLRAEIKQMNGEALVSPEQLRAALEKAYSAKRLAIQRLSGPALSMEHCYINLAIVENKREKAREEEGKVALNPFHRLPSAEAIHSNPQKLVPLDKLFEPRALNKGRTASPKRILIRGRAGVGKTTLSKKIVYDYTQQGQWRDRFDYMLWIPLRTLKGKTNCDLVTLFHEIYFQSYPQGLALAKTLAAQINGEAKEKTLFVLDGWDEVAQEWSEHEPMAEFVKHLMNQPAVVVTSRPYVDLKQVNPMDLELETIGFSPKDVTAYLDNPAILLPRQAQEMKRFIQATPLMQGLVNVPIQLDALCYSWDEIKRLQQEAEGLVTVTSLYQAMMNKLWRKDMLRLGKRESGELLTADQINAIQSFSRLERLVNTEQNFLSTLAFRGLQRNQIEFNQRDLHTLIDQLEAQGEKLPFTLEGNLKKLSFLHTDDEQQSYHFMHLTFQEFLAAKHFVQCWESEQEIAVLLSDAKRWTTASPEALVRQHKYNPRYEIFWWFVSGLLRAEALNRFFDVLENEPRDLFGAAHQRLMMNCLHEASRLPEVGLSSQIRDRLMQHLAQWLKFEIDQTETDQSQLASQPTFPESLLLDCLNWGALANTKIAVARALGDRSALSNAATQVLIELTKDQNDWVRSGAADALGQHSSLSRSALEALIGLTKGQDDGVRRRAAFALGQHSSLPESALKVLIELTKDQDDEVRRDAVYSLGQQSSLPESGMHALIELTKDQDDGVRLSAASALGQQSSLSESALKALIGLTKDQNDWVRRGAVFALGQQSSSSESALKVLIELTKGQDDKVRRSAAYALGQQSSLPESVLKVLIELMKDQDDGVRLSVAFALGQQSSLSESALKALIGLTKDQRDGVRRRAVFALGQHSSLPESALKVLIELTKDQDDEVRSDAFYALGQQSSLPESGMHALIELMKDQDDGVRRSAALALGQHSSLPESALKVLIGLTKDENEEVRRRAAFALGQQSSLPESALKVLIELTKDQRDGVRRSTADALNQHRWALYRLLPTLNRQQIALIYTNYLPKQRFNQSEPLYIQDNALCFYTAEGLQTVPFNHADDEAVFKHAIRQTQAAVGIPLTSPKKVDSLRDRAMFKINQWRK